MFINQEYSIYSIIYKLLVNVYQDFINDDFFLLMINSVELLYSVTKIVFIPEMAQLHFQQQSSLYCIHYKCIFSNTQQFHASA